MDDILSHQVFAQLDAFAVCGIFDGLIKSGKSSKVLHIWQHHEFETNILCFSYFIMAAVQCNDLESVQAIFAQLKLRSVDVSMDQFAWHSILSAFGHFGECERMWSAYYQMIESLDGQQQADIGSLCILCTFEQRKAHQIKALDEARKYICDWNQIPNERKKHFYRIACMAEHTEMQSLLWPYLESATMATPFIQVHATFFHGQRQIALDNSPKQNDEKDHEALTKALIDSVKHKIDTSIHPEIRSLDPHNYEFSDEYIQQRLSYHAEKRALAFLIDQNVKNIEIEVSMRMCSDCHRFFCSVSQKYNDRKIICIDPNKRRCI